MLDLNSLFDEAFYLSQNRDVASAISRGVFSSGFEHYRQIGQLEGRQPSALYNELYYLSAYADVAAAVSNRQITGIEHYIKFGQFEGRNASLLFNENYYLQKNSDLRTFVERDELTGIEHFVKLGQREGRNPSAFFNNSYYLANNPDVAAAVNRNAISGFQHFVRFGQLEGRNPTSLYDNSDYLGKNSDVAAAVARDEITGIQHYIKFGAAEKRPFTPQIQSALETVQILDLDEPPTGTIPGDADDPAIYVHPSNSSLSLVITTLKDGGMHVYDLNGQLLQSILPGRVRYNNVDLLTGFSLGGRSVDLAVASDRRNDTLAIFRINPDTRRLENLTVTNTIFTPVGQSSNGETTAYGLGTYRSPISGKTYVFVSRRETGEVAQIELSDNGSGQIIATKVRTLNLPTPSGGELEDAQVEGMVADRDLGFLYVGQENVGIWKFAAEVGGSNTGTLIYPVKPNGNTLEADVEGLTIYYGKNGTGYLLASSQGNNTFAIYDRQGNNSYLGSFAIAKSGNIDSVQESDGADVVSVPVGSQYPYGLLVVQDGFDDPLLLVEDEGELENVTSNFKFIPWENVANAFPLAIG
ncbi:phytase [Floridanema evergladense]|uniref:Phytase n=1 Tax=Floridaenema evergladense BLCC-F167 TaxID=3153639 RepID=A0ABV4WTJ5_9CYAN